jgi:hypothetical protein
MKTRQCDQAEARGRLRKAEQFLESAEAIRDLADDEADVGDAFVTLCVHAGVAAADVLCCVALGVHAQGDDHGDAVGLLARVQPNGDETSKSLRVLLAMKTKAGYSARAVNAEDRKRALRAAERLVTAARDRI